MVWFVRKHREYFSFYTIGAENPHFSLDTWVGWQCSCWRFGINISWLPCLQEGVGVYQYIRGPLVYHFMPYRDRYFKIKKCSFFSRKYEPID